MQSKNPGFWYFFQDKEEEEFIYLNNIIIEQNEPEKDKSMLLKPEIERRILCAHWSQQILYKSLMNCYCLEELFLEPILFKIPPEIVKAT